MIDWLEVCDKCVDEWAKSRLWEGRAHQKSVGMQVSPISDPAH